jgi:Homeodomain-like domain
VRVRRAARGRGGKGGAEPRARIRLREVKALQGLLDGHSQHEIARTLGVSQPAVSKMLKRIEERLLTDVAWRIERQRARQSLRLEFLYSEAIRAWRGSHDDALRRRQRKTDGVGGHTSTVAEVISENQHGDPRYLEEARRALADLRTLWGVDAPERLSVDTTNPYASMSDEAVAAEVLRQSDFLRRFLPITVSPDVPKED